MGGGGLLNGQDLLSVTKVICRWSLQEKIAGTLFEIKTNKNFKLLLGHITSTINNLSFFVVYVFFQFNNDLAMIIVTDRSLNHFDDCAAECVWRRVYLFFLGTQ